MSDNKPLITSESRAFVEATKATVEKMLESHQRHLKIHQEVIRRETQEISQFTDEELDKFITNNFRKDEAMREIAKRSTILWRSMNE